MDIKKTDKRLDNLITSHLHARYRGILSLSDLSLFLADADGKILLELIPSPDFCTHLCEERGGRICPDYFCRLTPDGEVSFKCGYGLESFMVPITKGDEIFGYLGGMQVYLPQTEYQKYMIDVQSLQCRIQPDKKPPELAGLEYIAKIISSLKTADPNNIRIHEQLCRRIAKNISLEINPHRQLFVENSLLYIKEHFKDKLTLEAVASKVFVNPKYFSHVFKQEMGVSFTEYVNSLKIEFACKLLATTNYHVNRISFKCGFSGPSYFNRVFCAQMNMTPQTYRKYASSNRAGND